MRTVGKHGEKATNPGSIYEVDLRRQYLDIAFRVVPVVALLVAVIFTWPSDNGDQVTAISADTTVAPTETATPPRRTTDPVDLTDGESAPEPFAVPPSTASTTTTARRAPLGESGDPVPTTRPGARSTSTVSRTTATTTQRSLTVPKSLVAAEPSISGTTTSTTRPNTVTPTTGTRTTTTRATSTQPRVTSAPVAPPSPAPASGTATTARSTTSTTRASTSRPTGAPSTSPTTARQTTTTARATTTTEPTTTLATTTTTLGTTTTTEETTTTLPTTTTTLATTTTTEPTTTTLATTTTEATTTTTAARSAGTCDSSGEFERVFRDDFNGSSLSGSWTQFGGGGYRGNGTRSSSALSVEGGRLIITADMVNGGLVSGGISHRHYQQYGKYVFRIRTDDDPSSAMSGVALTWPQSDDNRVDGENNIYETLANAVDRNPFYSFIHEPNGGVGDQKRFVHNADGSQFQTMTMEWTPDKISVTRSGPGGSVTTETQTLNETSADLIPDNPHRLSFQLDAYKNTVSQAVTMEVDWVEVHKYCG